jgi:hypothetical protein
MSGLYAVVDTAGDARIHDLVYDPLPRAATRREAYFALATEWRPQIRNSK